MTEKELHNKTIGELFEELKTESNPEFPEIHKAYQGALYNAESRTKAWAVAIVKNKLQCENVNDIPPYCVQYRCGERPTTSRIDPTTFCFNCRLKMFLKEKFEITEEDICAKAITPEG